MTWDFAELAKRPFASLDLLSALVTDRAMEAWYHPSIACMTLTGGSHGKPDRTTKILSHPARRRGGRVAARGKRAAGGDAGGRMAQQRNAARIRPNGGRVPPGSERSRLRREPECGDRIPLGRGSER